MGFAPCSQCTALKHFTSNSTTILHRDLRVLDAAALLTASQGFAMLIELAPTRKSNKRTQLTGVSLFSHSLYPNPKLSNPDPRHEFPNFKLRECSRRSEDNNEMTPQTKTQRQGNYCRELYRCRAITIYKQ